MVYLQLATITFNMGIRFEFGKALLPAFAILFWFAGALMAKAKRNFFIGIRTPWTLSSDKIWKATHKLGARLFKLAAVVILAGMLAPGFVAFVIMVVAVLAAALISIVYSYVLFAKNY